VSATFVDEALDTSPSASAATCTAVLMGEHLKPIIELPLGCVCSQVMANEHTPLIGVSGIAMN